MKRFLCLSVFFIGSAAIIGCGGSSAAPSKGGDKMGDGKMGDGKMGDGKMGDGKMGTTPTK